MSHTLINTKLSEHIGPVKKVHSIGTLRRVLEIQNFSKATLGEACKKVSNFERLSDHETEDGYSWFCGLNFRIADNEMVILIPWAQDWKKRHGSQFDRSIAVYCTKAVPVNDINIEIFRIAKELSEAITALNQAAASSKEGEE